MHTRFQQEFSRFREDPDSPASVPAPVPAPVREKKKGRKKKEQIPNMTAPPVQRSRTVRARLHADSLRAAPYPQLREKSNKPLTAKKKKIFLPDAVAGGGELAGSSSSTTLPASSESDATTNCAPRQSQKSSTARSCPRCMEMGHVATTCTFKSHLPDALTCHQCVRTYKKSLGTLDVHITLCSAHAPPVPADPGATVTDLRQRRMRDIMEKVEKLTNEGLSMEKALTLCNINSVKYDKIRKMLC